MAGVEGEECDALLLPGVLRLHLPDGLQGFVHEEGHLLGKDFLPVGCFLRFAGARAGGKQRHTCQDE